MQFTVSRETYEKLRQAQDLLQHTIPTRDPAAIVERALTLLLADAQRTKFASTPRPRAPQAAGPRSRRIPASVRREVWKRDGGRRAFVGANGRCPERGFLEFHYVVPYADGGSATVENLELRCRAHNAYEAARWSGGSDTLFVKEQRAGFWPTRSGPTLSDPVEKAGSGSRRQATGRARSDLITESMTPATIGQVRAYVCAMPRLDK